VVFIITLDGFLRIFICYKQIVMKKVLFLLTGMFGIASFAQQYELPAPASREQQVKHLLFTLSYHEGYELASWVAWQVSPEQAKATGVFKEKYTGDPLVTTGTSEPKDYKDAGFIIAQLAPAADMFTSQQAVEETFLMSNAVPQKPAFNKYIWQTNEKLIREWAKEGHTLYVVAGPVLADAPFGTFGGNKVSIPIRYYKAVLDADGSRAIGFVFRNNVSTGTPKSFAVSIDDLETITGIDFFPQLQDDIENEVESSKDFGKWNFQALEQ
jgi:endonuclease G